MTPLVLRDGSPRRCRASVRVETGEENAERSSSEIRDSLGFLPTMLLVFAFVALFVGAFLIFNTFSITVAQRIAEFGMLRTLGASRGQILRSVIGESFAIGLLGSLIGIACGFVIALRLESTVRSGRGRPADHRPGPQDPHGDRLAAGRGRGDPGLLADPGAALDPGAADRRAARRGRAAEPARRVINAVLAGLLGVVGLAMLLIGLFGGADGDAAAGLMGAGAVVFVIAVSLFSPVLVRPLAALAGWPLETDAAADRAARARERPAQPRPHRDHRGGADDRPRPGRLRDRSSPPGSRARSPRPSTTPSRATSWSRTATASRRSRPAPPTRPARARGRAGGDDARDRSEAGRQRRQAADQRLSRRTPARSSSSNGSEGGQRLLARPARRPGDRQGVLRRRRTTSRSATASGC